LGGERGLASGTGTLNDANREGGEDWARQPRPDAFDRLRSEGCDPIAPLDPSCRRGISGFLEERREFHLAFLGQPTIVDSDSSVSRLILQ
jgi:hypothetical protein